MVLLQSHPESPGDLLRLRSASAHKPVESISEGIVQASGPILTKGRIKLAQNSTPSEPSEL